MPTAETLRVYKSVHTWTGIVAGLALFIAFYAGALSVFKEPVARWVTPAAERLPHIGLERTPELLDKALAAHPEIARTGVTLNLQNHENAVAQLTWSVTDSTAEHAPQVEWAAWLDEAGTLHSKPLANSTVSEFIDFVHRRAGLPESFAAGEWLMGGICILYGLALVSGVIVLLPTLVKDFFALRPGRNFKRMWLDAHNVVGIISLPFHVIMAVTAAVFLLHDPIYDAQDKYFYDNGLSAVWRAAYANNDAPASAPMLTPMELLARLKQQAPDLTPLSFTYQQLGSGKTSIRVIGQDYRHMNHGAQGGFVGLNPYTGEITNRTMLPGQTTGSDTWLASFFSLHFASYGGNLVRWGYFLLGLAGAFLFYSGNLLWIESRRRKEKKQSTQPVTQSRSTLLMASLTVGVAIGCMAGLSLTLVSGKWLYGHVSDLNAWHQAIYYTTFLGSIVWALLRQAPRAAVELLWFATLCTAAIPLTSLVGVCWPASGWWAHDSMTTLAVDVSAATGALALAFMARATQRRVRNGRTDSVWAVPQTQQAAQIWNRSGR